MKNENNSPMLSSQAMTQHLPPLQTAQYLSIQYSNYEYLLNTFQFNI